MNFEGGLQLCDGEKSWPQERPSSVARPTSSDLNLLRLSGVPRAHQMPSHQHATNPDSDALDADGAEGGASWPQCLPETPANPRDSADNPAEGFDDDADGGGSWPQCAPPMHNRGKAMGRRRPPALAITPISQDGALFDQEPPTPSNGGCDGQARPQSAASGCAAGGMAMAPFGLGSGCHSHNSQAETPKVSLCRPRRSNVIYLRRALRADPADCSGDGSEKRPTYVRHTAVLEPDGEGSFEIVSEHARYNSVKEFVAHVKQKERQDLMREIAQERERLEREQEREEREQESEEREESEQVANGEDSKQDAKEVILSQQA